MSRHKLVAGNWKLNGSMQSINELVGDINSQFQPNDNASLAVCPPYIYLPMVQKLLEGSSILLGSQNVCEHESGAYTGEVSVSMLMEYGCHYVIIGHSERRHIYGETNELIVQKFAAVQQAGLTPILCVGELLEKRESGETESVVAEQLDSVIKHCGADSLSKSVIAYEPVWAIGTGKTASPEQAQAVHSFIRGRVAQSAPEVAEQLQILYGGSVNAKNAAELFSQADIDGGLIGGASLKSHDFLAIYNAAV